MKRVIMEVFFWAMLVGILWIAYMAPRWLDEIVEERIKERAS